MKISVTNLKNIFKKVIGSENESVSSEEPKSEQVQQIEKVQQKAEKMQENQAQPVKVIKDSQPEKQLLGTSAGTIIQILPASATYPFAVLFA